MFRDQCLLSSIKDTSTRSTSNHNLGLNQTGSVLNNIHSLLSNFMQSEPLKVTQKILNPEQPQKIVQHSQHGVNNQDELTAGLFPQGADLGDSTHVGLGTETTIPTTGIVADLAERSSQRLSSTSPSPTRSQGERIIEYEKATRYSSKKRRGGLGFTVVQRNRTQHSDQSSIFDFPNGMYQSFIMCFDIY